MKTLVTYYSRTGNTRKVAEAIFDEIEEQKDLIPIEEVSDIETYDMLFVGSPIERHGVVDIVREFLHNEVHGKLIAMFITHAAAEQMEIASMYVEQCKELVNDVSVLLGLFNCQGELSESLANHMARSENPQLREFASKRKFTLDQPNEERIQKSRQFAREMSLNASSIITQQLSIVKVI